ncbi:MAG: zinc ribbon domain-containing protein [Anaerolineales bacterium]|nr:zinc ribbon domain-containing protein [Anaerolineales bacterium]
MSFNPNSLTTYALILAAFLGAFLSALWLSLVIWTFRDMRSRSRDVFAQVLAAAVVAVLTLPGLVIYLILRPPKTLAEAYAQSLEEEALLQEIEEKRVCPGCGRQAREDWRICPNCLTKLKKPCAQCGQLMDLPWNVCPYCATPVEGARPAEPEPAADLGD